MEFNTKKVDEANAVVSAIISKEILEKNLDKLAKQAAKTLDIQGFRKGKVPVSIVKQRYADKLREDAQNEAVRDVLTNGLKELDIKNEDLVGEPNFSKFEKKDDGSVDVEIKVDVKPNIDLGDYKALLPEVEDKKVEQEEIDKRLEEMAKGQALPTKIARKRMVRDKDIALIDFEGFVDGEPFDGGKAEKYPLMIGSGSFIPGFEEQVIGMKYEEEKDITVTFPEDYQAENLKGKEAVFKVKLHEIQERIPVEIDDEFAKKMLPNEKEATVDMLKEQVTKQMKEQEKAVYYRDELKPLYLEKLVEAINFALPSSVIEQEINLALNNKAKQMKEEELKELQDNPEKIEELREELREDAQNSVKATFIVDALAKAEKVEVSDQEVMQVLYYEAMQMGQNPQEIVKQYEQAGYLPAVKMSMIEERVISKLLDEKL